MLDYQTFYFVVKNDKDKNVLFLADRLIAIAYSYGINVELKKGETGSRDFKIDYNHDGMSTKLIRNHASLASILHLIVTQLSLLFEFTKSIQIRDNLHYAIRDTKSKSRFSGSPKDDPLFIDEIVEIYRIFYAREVVGKEELSPDEIPFSSGNNSEKIHLISLVKKIRNKVELSNHQWTKENAIKSFTHFMEASFRFPINKNQVSFFTLKKYNTNFDSIYLHIKKCLDGKSTRETAGSRESKNSDQRDGHSGNSEFEKYF